MTDPHFPELLPPQALDWAELVPMLGRAHYSLGQYRGALDALKVPDIYFYPMATKEAEYSSRIEGTVADYEDVAEGMDKPGIDPELRLDIEEVMNYRRAMLFAKEQMTEKPLNLNLIKEMHTILLDGVRGQNKGRGQFRMTQNWIGAHKMENARYVPPPPERVPELLDNWEKYLHAVRPGEERPPYLMTERDPLVQIAALHAQFEIIHPFNDGNGRIGRLVIPLFLYQRELISQPVFTISPYINANRKIYYDLLKEITDHGNWHNWTIFFLQGIYEQASWDISLINDIVNLYQQVVELTAASQSQYIQQAIRVLFQEPVLTLPDFVEALSLPRQTAADLFKALEDAGVIELIEPAAGRRAAKYSFLSLVRLMKDGTQSA